MPYSFQRRFGDGTAGLVDIRVGLKQGIDNFDIRSRDFAGQDHIIGQGHLIHRSLDVAAGSTAQDAQNQRLTAQSLDDLGDIDALSAGVQARSTDSVDRIDRKARQNHGLIQCRVQGDSNDHGTFLFVHDENISYLFYDLNKKK